MKTRYISRTIFLLAFGEIAKGFTRLLPPKRAMIVRFDPFLSSLHESQKNSARDDIAHELKKVYEEGDNEDETERRLIGDLQNQQSEHAYWMSQPPDRNNNKVGGGSRHNNNNELSQIQELEEDVDHWKDRFHEMRFKWVRENGRRQNQVKELKEKMKHMEDEAQREKNRLLHRLATRDIQICSVMAELGHSKKQLEEAQEVILKKEEHMTELKENQRNLWTLCKTGFRLLRRGIVKKTRRLLRHPAKEFHEDAFMEY